MENNLIEIDDIEFGEELEPITITYYTRRINGLTYHYRNEDDAEHYEIRDDDDQLVNKDGKRINRSGKVIPTIKKSDFDYRKRQHKLNTERKRKERPMIEKKFNEGNYWHTDIYGIESEIYLDDWDTSESESEPEEGFAPEDQDEEESKESIKSF